MKVKRRAVAVLVLSAFAIAACSGSARNPTAAFRSTTHSAWVSASTVDPKNAAGEERAASAWRGFAVTVQGLDAGSDKVQQGQLVALANEAADAYAATANGFMCQIKGTMQNLDGSYPSTANCPTPAQEPAGLVTQIQSVMNGL